ncbi:MAG: YihY/virulence factor BrkB family protein, partial [Chloroflexota bacterium]
MAIAPVRFGVALVREFDGDDLTGMAAEMAYSFLFALFPLLLLSAAIIGMIGGVLGRRDLLVEAMARVAPFLPTPVADLVGSAILDLITERAGAIALFGLLLALWGAASGVGALMKGLNRAYGVARAQVSWRRQGVTAVAALLVTPLGLALLVLSVVGHGLTTWLGAVTGMSELVALLVAALRIPFAFLVLFGAMTLVYWTLPALRQRYRDVLPGSLVAATGWSVITFAFGVYIADIDEYRVTYGIFGAAIAFLLWLYLVGLVILIGA